MQGLPTYSLWGLTEGQRRTYGWAIVAMIATNLCLFAAPLIGKYAIDTLVAQDLAAALPWLGQLAATVT